MNRLVRKIYTHAQNKQSKRDLEMSKSWPFNFSCLVSENILQNSYFFYLCGTRMCTYSLAAFPLHFFYRPLAHSVEEGEPRASCGDQAQ